MYSTHFDLNDHTDEELKSYIFGAAHDLAEGFPDYLRCDPNEIPMPETETLGFIVQINELLSRTPERTAWAGSSLGLITLHDLWRTLKVLVYAAEAEERLIALSRLIFSRELLELQYGMAADLIETELRKDLSNDRTLVSAGLRSEGLGLNELETVKALIAAEEEISRVLRDERIREPLAVAGRFREVHKFVPRLQLRF